MVARIPVLGYEIDNNWATLLRIVPALLLGIIVLRIHEGPAGETVAPPPSHPRLTSRW